MPVVIVREKCTGCETCISVCPFDSIVIKDEKAFINEYCQNCKACITVCPEGAITETEEAPKAGPSADYKGVWVFAECRDGQVAGVAYELLGAGRRLAGDLGVELSAVLLGAGEATAKELISYGADKVYYSNDPIFKHFGDEPYAEAVIRLAEQYKPEIILAGATPIGRSFIPRVAARLKTGLTADCTSLEIDKETRNLLQVRPAFGGNIMATIVCPSSRPQISTVRPRVMKKVVRNPERKGELIAFNADGIKSKTKVLESVREATGAVSLQDAEIIVSAGRGTGGKKGVALLKELSDILGGTLGGSRAAVDEGWIPHSQQIGQTGKTVCPKLYIACGISGAVQHLVGMQSSDVIVAINKNAEAPIFEASSYGLVGDMNEIVPLLIKKIREIKGSS